MAQTLFYSSTAVSMQLASGGIGSGDTTCTLSATTGLPASYPFKLLIDWGTASQEVVYCTGVSGYVATIQRGKDGSTAQSHTVGATVVHGVSAEEFNAPNLHIAATSGVHGVTGNVVGHNDAQTLTNKTMSGASNTFSNIAQSATHASPDTDAATTSLHHTIGTSATQAAAGNHLHTGTYQPAGSYAAASHSHAESDVTNLTTDLGNKSAVGHTHSSSNITDIGSASVNYANSAGSANGVAWGNVSGRPLSNIKGGETTVSFSGGTGSLPHNLGFTPAGAAVSIVDGSNSATNVYFNGPTAWDGSNLYLRCSNGTSGISGNVTVGWVAFG